DRSASGASTVSASQASSRARISPTVGTGGPPVGSAGVPAFATEVVGASAAEVVAGAVTASVPGPEAGSGVGFWGERVGALTRGPRPGCPRGGVPGTGRGRGRPSAAGGRWRGRREGCRRRVRRGR